MKRHVLILVLLLSLFTLMGLKLKLDALPRQRIPGSSIIYLPSGQYLKYATLGYSSMAADMIYLWAIQYYSDTEILDRYTHLKHIFSVITDLDPHYLDPYEIGAIISVYEAKDFSTAFQILDLAIQNNPRQWIFPFEAGHYAQQFLKDYQLARRYYKKAMAIPGAPSQTKRLFANASYEVRDYQTALQTWNEVLQNAKDDRTRKIALNHLYRVRAVADVKTIKTALDTYKARYGHNPRDLALLVQSGYLAAVPKDMDGKDYLYNPKTGEIKPPTIPWKR